jgi:phytanoyl-CoA hydroxylase
MGKIELGLYSPTVGSEHPFRRRQIQHQVRRLRSAGRVASGLNLLSHTNDNLAAVGVMIDDMMEENGPLMVMPVIRDRSMTTMPTAASAGRWTRARSASICRAPCLAQERRARSACIMSVRSTLQRRTSPPISRRFLLLQFRAADAWPLLNEPASWEAWPALLVAGENTLEPRCISVPVRWPLPLQPTGFYL